MGELFQWHRNEPIANTALTGSLAFVDSGATFAGHSLFITGSVVSGYNWAAFTGTNSDPLWMNSPCGTGYVIPTSSDWGSAINIIGQNFAAFTSTLKLPLAGDRPADGSYISGHGYYWNAEPSGTSAKVTWLQSSGSGVVNIGSSQQRSIGSSIRCMLNISGSGSSGG